MNICRNSNKNLFFYGLFIVFMFIFITCFKSFGCAKFSDYEYSDNQNNHEVAASLLKTGTIDVKDKNGLTPLCWAALKGNDEFAHLLLEKGANANSASEDGDTPLICALKTWIGLPDESKEIINKRRENKVKIFHKLLEHQADVNHLNKDGISPLMQSVLFHIQENDMLMLISKLLEKGADINQKSDNGNTALIYAVNRELEIVTKYLIDKGAEIDVINKSGKSPLSIAISKNNTAIVGILRGNK